MGAQTLALTFKRNLGYFKYFYFRRNSLFICLQVAPSLGGAGAVVAGEVGIPTGDGRTTLPTRKVITDVILRERETQSKARPWSLAKQVVIKRYEYYSMIESDAGVMRPPAPPAPARPLVITSQNNA